MKLIATSLTVFVMICCIGYYLAWFLDTQNRSSAEGIKQQEISTPHGYEFISDGIKAMEYFAQYKSYLLDACVAEKQGNPEQEDEALKNAANCVDSFNYYRNRFKNEIHKTDTVSTSPISLYNI